LESIEEEEDMKMSSLKMTSHTEDCLGGEVPLGTAHTINEAVASFCGLPKKDHAKLKAPELLKLKKQAEEGLEWKFVLMKPVLKTTGEIDVDKLKSIYPMSIRIGEFHESLRRYDMDDVFTLIPEEFVVNNTKENAGLPVVQGYRVCFLSQVDLLLTMFASTVCMQALMDLIIWFRICCGLVPSSWNPVMKSCLTRSRNAPSPTHLWRRQGQYIFVWLWR